MSANPDEGSTSVNATHTEAGVHEEAAQIASEIVSEVVQATVASMEGADAEVAEEEEEEEVDQATLDARARSLRAVIDSLLHVIEGANGVFNRSLASARIWTRVLGQPGEAEVPIEVVATGPRSAADAFVEADLLAHIRDRARAADTLARVEAQLALIQRLRDDVNALRDSITSNFNNGQTIMTIDPLDVNALAARAQELSGQTTRELRARQLELAAIYAPNGLTRGGPSAIVLRNPERHTAVQRPQAPQQVRHRSAPITISYYPLSFLRSRFIRAGVDVKDSVLVRIPNLCLATILVKDVRIGSFLNTIPADAFLRPALDDCNICLQPASSVPLRVEIGVDPTATPVLRPVEFPPTKHIALTTCGHAFHSECLHTWLCDMNEAIQNKTCPMCRAHIAHYYLFEDLQSYKDDKPEWCHDIGTHAQHYEMNVVLRDFRGKWRLVTFDYARVRVASWADEMRMGEWAARGVEISDRWWWFDPAF